MRFLLVATAPGVFRKKRFLRAGEERCSSGVVFFFLLLFMMMGDELVMAPAGISLAKGGLSCSLCKKCTISLCLEPLSY